MEYKGEAQRIHETILDYLLNRARLCLRACMRKRVGGRRETERGKTAENLSALCCSGGSSAACEASSQTCKQL